MLCVTVSTTTLSRFTRTHLLATQPSHLLQRIALRTNTTAFIRQLLITFGLSVSADKLGDVFITHAPRPHSAQLAFRLLFHLGQIDGLQLNDTVALLKMTHFDPNVVCEDGVPIVYRASFYEEAFMVARCALWVHVLTLFVRNAVVVCCVCVIVLCSEIAYLPFKSNGIRPERQFHLDAAVSCSAALIQLRSQAPEHRGRYDAPLHRASATGCAVCFACVSKDSQTQNRSKPGSYSSGKTKTFRRTSGSGTRATIR